MTLMKGIVPDALPRAVLDVLPHNVTIVDARHRLVYANASFWHSTNIHPDACPIGSPIVDLIRILAYRGLYGPGDPEDQVEALLRVDRGTLFRRRVRSADGRMTTEIMSYPLPDGGYATCGIDVTAWAQSEATLQARLGLLEGAVGRLRGGLAVFDDGLRLDLVNPAYGALIGIPGTLTPGMTLRDVLQLQEARGELPPGRAAELLARVERERARSMEMVRERPSGEVLRFLNQPTPEGGFQIEVIDITALRRAEDEARRRAALLDGVKETRS